MTHSNLFDPGAEREADGEDADNLPKSKSQRKREMHALQDLAEELVALNRGQLAKLPLSDDLREVIHASQRVRGHEAVRRQMQYLGKLMRRLDETEVEAIRAVLGAFRNGSKAETARLHRIERLRDALLADDAALTTFLAEHPHADAQTLRALIRNARREAATGKPPKNFRELFQEIRVVLEQSAALHTPETTEEDDDDAPTNPNTP